MYTMCIFCRCYPACTTTCYLLPSLHHHHPTAQDLAQQLCEITGFDAVSLQPNSGASGEYAGLMAIRAYHHANGDHHRTVCLIPTSAHGTNPASAVMAGMQIVAVGTDAQGNIDIADMRAKAEANADKLAAYVE